MSSELEEGFLSPFNKPLFSGSSDFSRNLHSEVWHPFRPCNQDTLRSGNVPSPQKRHRVILTQALHYNLNSTRSNVRGVQRPTSFRSTPDNRPATAGLGQLFCEMLGQSEAIHLATNTFTGDCARVLQVKNNLFHVENSETMALITGEFAPQTRQGTAYQKIRLERLC